MKKIASFLVVIICLFILSGCNTPAGEACRHTWDEGAYVDGAIEHTCTTCGDKYQEATVINTQANFTFMPSPKSSLHREELRVAYEAFVVEQNWDVASKGTYEIFNFTSEDISNKYNLDVFEVCYQESSYYFIRHNGVVYQAGPIGFSHINSHCINHVAITDINRDGYIEILTAINSFAERQHSYYCSSFVTVTDTKSQYSIEIRDGDDVSYFKENEDGVICIYNANGIMPVADDLVDGILDDKYYDLATNLFDTPVLNTSYFQFKERNFTASCDLFDVDVTVQDDTIRFPYLFKHTSTPPFFDIEVSMKYLGETFSYTSPDTYLDGAVVAFVNDSSSTYCTIGGGFFAVTEFTVTTGMEINSSNRYSEWVDECLAVGVYDMVITYTNEENNIRGSITIEDFLRVYR